MKLKPITQSINLQYKTWYHLLTLWCIKLCAKTYGSLTTSKLKMKLIWSQVNCSLY